MLESMNGFRAYLFKVTRVNFPKLTGLRGVFSDKERKNDPLYYIERVRQMDDAFAQDQLLVSLIVCFNYFSINPGDTIGLARWDTFVMGYRDHMNRSKIHTTMAECVPTLGIPQ